MSDLKEKLTNARSKLFHRTPATTPTSSTPSPPRKDDQPHSYFFTRRKSSGPGSSSGPLRLGSHTYADPQDARSDAGLLSTSTDTSTSKTTDTDRSSAAIETASPVLTVESPTPEPTPPLSSPKPVTIKKSHSHPLSLPTPDSPPLSPGSRATEIPIEEPISQQPPENLKRVNTPSSLEDKKYSSTASQDYFGRVLQDSRPAMSRRKIWIKRAGASPTLVQIAHDDLVDDVRDMVLRKYANSLGRTFDAPDVALRIVPRERSQQERILSPEEPMSTILDAYFPGGQNIEEALLIDVPRKRTPLPSPRIMYYNSSVVEDNRPVENGNGYFPPMPASSPHPSHSAASHDSRHSHHESHPHSIAVVETGQLPVLPSPRERRAPHNHHRPKYSRHHTSSPTVMTPSGQVMGNNTSVSARPQYSRVDPELRRSHNPTAPPPPLPTPPAPDVTSKTLSAKVSTPPLDKINSPHTVKIKKFLKPSMVDAQQQQQEQQEGQIGRKPSQAHHQMSFSLLEATVPPINVLIVEDNPINLRLLEMFTKRLKVRWQTAMNGRDAVVKWRAGGFHLVLMDIQLPIMSGLEATKEIRRLEKVNGIGVFAKSQEEETGEEARGAGTEQVTDGDGDSKLTGPAKGDDKLSDEGLFKSPVIIVALTASSLQSDRHEALAAGCNDFLTKPVHFPWLQRKVMEWGCMQALIDFDGWRKWKDLVAEADLEKQKEEDLDPDLKAKREKKDARRAAIMAKMGQG